MWTSDQIHEYVIWFTILNKWMNEFSKLSNYSEALDISITSKIYYLKALDCVFSRLRFSPVLSNLDSKLTPFSISSQMKKLEEFSKKFCIKVGLDSWLVVEGEVMCGAVAGSFPKLAHSHFSDTIVCRIADIDDSSNFPLLSPDKWVKK